MMQNVMVSTSAAAATDVALLVSKAWVLGHKNKATAMKVLKAKLYQIELDREKEQMKSLEDKKKDIAWGSQIRSYVFHPYNMVKDHRTKEETSNISKVMNGEIDNFINSFLINNLKN